MNDEQVDKITKGINLIGHLIVLLIISIWFNWGFYFFVYEG